MNMQQINLAIVGCGWIADRHIEAYQWMWENDLKYFNIVSICDLIEDAAKLRAERIGEFQRTKPKETKIEGLIDKIEVDVEDTALSLIKFENDVLLEWTLTSAAPRKEFGYQILYGSEGCIDYGAKKVYSEGKEYELSKLQEEMMKSLDEETKECFFPGGSTSQFVIELTDFAQAILQKRKPEIDGMEGMKDVAVCMAVYESSTLNQLVKLADIESRKIENYQRGINESLGI